MQALKPIPKFNSGHFPVGTVVDMECVFTPLMDEAPEYEGQIYGLVRNATVSQLETNGPGSWVITVDTPHPCETFRNLGNTTNIAWVRAIHKRGKDTCAPRSTSVRFASLISKCLMEAEDFHEHHYDVDKLQSAVYSLVPEFRFHSNKKLKKIIRRLMPRFKIPRKTAVRHENEMWDRMFQDEH